jgi:REP-associated tyrosine transposase
MSKYKEKYRVESTRLKTWDYRNGGYYYITILTKNRIHYFGKVKNDLMVLNKAGKIAKEELIKTQEIRNNVEIDEFIIMPNHLHFILIISREKKKITPTTLQPNSLGSIVGQYKSAVSRRLHLIGYANFGWHPRFYEHIIRNEKALYNIRKYIRLNPFKWELDEYYRK